MNIFKAGLGIVPGVYKVNCFIDVRNRYNWQNRPKQLSVKSAFVSIQNIHLGNDYLLFHK